MKTRIFRYTTFFTFVFLSSLLSVKAQQSVLAEDFNSCSGNNLPSGWTKFSVTGSEVWQCSNAGYTNNAIRISGYSNGNNNTNEDWLISPLINLASYTQPQLHFLSWTRFTGSTLQVYVSNNYVPLSSPATATWTLLNPQLPALNSQYWEGSGSVDLTPFKNQPCVVAFKYNATTSAASTWMVDDITVVDGIFSCAKQFLNVGETTSGTTTTALTVSFSMSTIKGLFEVNVPNPFEISKDGINFGQTISYDSTVSGVQQTMYVRIHPTTSDKIYRGTLTFQANGKLLSDKISLFGSSIPPNSRLKTCQWNMRWFGDPNNCACDTNLSKMQAMKVLADAQADLYALQEVVSTQQLQQVCASLGSRFKAVYAGFCSGATNPGSINYPGCQKLAFIYDTTKIKSLGEFGLLASTYPSDTSANSGYFCFSSGRFPYVFKAQLQLAGGGLDTVYLVNIHAKASGTISDYNRRVCAASKMTDSLNSLFPNKKILILGDYNDYLVGTHVNGQSLSPYQSLLNSNFTGITLPSVFVGQTTFVGSSNHIIDNVVCSNTLLPKYIDSACFIFSEPLAYINHFASTTSDHFPVISYWRFNFPQQSNSNVDIPRINPSIFIQNPTLNHLIIHNQGIALDLVELQLIDLSGRQIMHREMPLIFGETLVNTGFIPEGIYILILRSKQGIHRFTWMNR